MKKAFVLALIAIQLYSFAQKGLDTLGFRTKFVGLPVVFYQPETKLGFGAAGFLSFKSNRFDSILRVSQINLGGAYTLEKQLLLYASYDLWLDKNNYNIFGEIGYYRYFYYFYGIGNGNRNEEAYNVNYPRVRITAERKLFPHFYVGLKYIFDDFDVIKRDSNGVLIQNTVTGAKGGIISGLGISSKYDSRNSNFYPTKGWKINANITFFDQFLGSDFSYTATELDVIKYKGFGKDRVLATYAYARFINSNGNAPFFHLSNIGGNKRMRGYYDGFYMDKQLIGWQTEYRTPVWWRFGLVGFVGNAVVASHLSSVTIKNVRTTAGAGLRFLLDKERKINLRVDYGFSKESSGFYLTIGEAF